MSAVAEAACAANPFEVARLLKDAQGQDLVAFTRSARNAHERLLAEQRRVGELMDSQERAATQVAKTSEAAQDVHLADVRRTELRAQAIAAELRGLAATLRLLERPEVADAFAAARACAEQERRTRSGGIVAVEAHLEQIVAAFKGARLDESVGRAVIQRLADEFRIAIGTMLSPATNHRRHDPLAVIFGVRPPDPPPPPARAA